MKILSLVKIYVPYQNTNIKQVYWCTRSYDDISYLRYIRKNGANYMVFDDAVITKMWCDEKGYYKKNRFGPCAIKIYYGGLHRAKEKEIVLRWRKGLLESVIDIEKEEWLCAHNIVLSEENNYEIPDEYKAAFRLRFM